MNHKSDLANQSVEIAWAVLVLTLPFSSFPLVSRLAGGTMVAPLAFIPLLWIIIFLAIPYLLKKGTLPTETKPLFVLILVIIISSALAFFRAVPTYYQATILPEILRSFITLCIGLAFYFTTIIYLNSSKRIDRTILWVDMGGAITILWSLLQGFFFLVKGVDYPQWLYDIQSLLSSGSLYYRRMTGFAFEPSWLAHELNMVYIPFWLAILLTGHSAFHKRFFNIPFETLLLVFSLFVLFITSRVGMLAEFLVIFYLLILACNAIGNWVYQRWSLRNHRTSQRINVSIHIILFLFILVAFIGIAYGIVYLVGEKIDPRFSVVYTIKDHIATLINNPYDLAKYLQIAERFDRWVTGWNIFDQHPFFGVGFGVSGFYFLQNIPSQGWDIPEIANTFMRSGVVPNLKSFWFRLLAETGIFGFSAFFTWFILQSRDSFFLRKQNEPINQMIGWVGIFTVISFLAEGLSIDSFALPYLWFTMGAVTAATTLVRKYKHQE